MAHQHEDRERVAKRPIEAPEVLNEAYCYDRPSAFSRGMRVEMGDYVMLFISGTASVGAEGESLHAGDIRKQCERMFHNVTVLLAAEGADWQDIARTTIYIADMRDYATLNEVRCAFYDSQGLQPYPASTCIEARICRPELLVEMEAIAVVPAHRKPGS
jgi:enamine deaminase RidA (YjgF/YER057c/UK114 family)